MQCKKVLLGCQLGDCPNLTRNEEVPFQTHFDRASLAKSIKLI